MVFVKIDFVSAKMFSSPTDQGLVHCFDAGFVCNFINLFELVVIVWKLFALEFQNIAITTKITWI